MPAARLVVAVTASVAAAGALAAPARADDLDCPMDATVAAGGTWSTRIAEVVDACADDPACTAGQVDADSPQLLWPPATRSPRGRFAIGDATLGARARGLYAGGPAEGEAHALLVAGGRAGWHRGLQVCGKTAIDAGPHTSGRTGLGLAFPHAFWSVSIGFEQDWQVQPALSAPRQWLRRAYTQNRAAFSFQVATWRGKDGAVSSVLPMRMGATWQDQRDAVGAEPRMLENLSGAAFERLDERGTLRVLPWSSDAVYEMIDMPGPPDPSAPPPPATSWLGTLGVLAIDRTLADGVRLELDGGYVWSSERLRCRGCAPFAGVLGLTVPRGDDRWSVRATRAAYLAFDDVVTIEDRLTAGWTRSGRRHALRATAFAAATRTSAAGPDLDVEVTGGGAVAVDLGLPQGLTMTTELEVARSFYAHLDGTLAPQAEPAARLGLVVSRHFGHHAAH